MPIDSPPLDASALDRALTALRTGGIGVFPTETFYGLAADALDARAVDRVAALKGRAAGKAIACIIGAVAQWDLLCAEWPPEAERLAREFWPGALTLVLPARAGLPSGLRPEGWVGLRWSSHPWAQRLATQLGRPITATSANLGGAAEASRVEAIDPEVRGGVDFVLDAGSLPGGKGSTVVKLGDEGPLCLREGAIPFSAVRALLAQPP
jgi:L-threonylcarbamoyladenylate synthase